MNKLLHLIKSLRVEIRYLFIVAVVTILLIDFYLIDIPELFKGGYKLGQVAYKLSMSYISAFIFYFLIVHMKAQKDKASVYTFVQLMVARIIAKAKLTLKSMCDESKVTLLGEYPNEDELNEILRSLHPYAQAPLILGGHNSRYANWRELFVVYRNESNKATAKTLAFTPYLDAELIDLLARIEDNQHFNTTTLLENTRTGDKDLRGWRHGFIDYFGLIDKLQSYHKKKLAKYA
jgi:hypothetical protein